MILIDYGNFQSRLTQTGSEREEIMEYEDSENQTPWRFIAHLIGHPMYLI